MGRRGGHGHFTLVGEHHGRASEKVAFKLRQVARKSWLCGNEDVGRQKEVETDGREQLRRQDGETAALAGTPIAQGLRRL